MKLEDILTWNDWCMSFQDIETFRPLIEEIFLKHNLKLSEIKHTYPGTNAVFKVGKYIVKIFVPDGVKQWDADDYSIEYQNAISNKHFSNYTPQLYAAGSIKKDKVWKYLVFEYVEGTLLHKIADDLSYKEKSTIVNQLKDFLLELNQVPKVEVDNTYIKNRVINDSRWDFLNKKVKEELHEYLMNEDISNSVIVHGDITGDNVLLRDQGILIIDFGDSCIAPAYYEYAPIILDLFQCDRAFMELFFVDVEAGITKTIKSILLHDFGGNMASDLLQGERVGSLKELKEKLRSKIMDRK